MKKISRIVTLVLVSAFIFAACGKYEEGPKFSLATKKARLVNKWKIESAYLNGTSVPLTSDDTNGYIEFKKDGTLTFVYTDDNTTTTTEGTWEFSDDKEQIKVTTTYSDMTVTESQDIIRLKSKELWLKYSDEYETSETHYVPYED